MNGSMLIKNYMEIKDKELVEILKDREKTIEKGYPLYDQIEKIVTEVIKNNMPRIAADGEMWQYLKPYIDPKEYKETNTKLKEIYRHMQKIDYKLNRLKEKVTTKINKADIKLGEFEEISKVSLKGNKVIVETIDKIESYKEMLREKKN